MPQVARPFLSYTRHLLFSPTQRLGGLGDPHAAAAGTGAGVQEKSRHTSDLSLALQSNEMYTQSRSERSAGWRKRRCISPETFPLTFKTAHSQRAHCCTDPLPHALPWPCCLPTTALPGGPSSLSLKPLICLPSAMPCNLSTSPLSPRQRSWFPL